MPLNNCQVLGITGGIGSGKSIVSRVIQNMNIPVYDCDKEAKRLNETDPIIREKLKMIVGSHVYSDNGLLNKSVLAEYLFKSQEHTKEINRIIHPRVREDFQEWLTTQSTSMVGIESAILFESGFDNLADVIIQVSAPKTLRIERTIKRDHTNKQAVEQRINKQYDDTKIKELADYRLINDNRHPLLPQILDILNVLLCLSPM